MTIAVTTPTGKVGSRMARLLVQAGVRPALLVRDPDTLDPTVGERTDPRQVDLGDLDALTAATVDVEALFWVCPPADADDPTQAYARLGDHAAAAVRTNDIGRVVFSAASAPRRAVGSARSTGWATPRPRSTRPTPR